MTDAEFVQWLDNEVDGNRITSEQRQDLIDQKRIFEVQRRLIEQEHRYKIVGFVAGERRVAQEIHALLDTSKAQFPSRMIYFEPIGFQLL